ncbi:MAG: hypothetical protein H6617_00815 [Bdellovibrionaceae bacterium]|nr:hypothetical protein [Bdellovibrionales bacterium]MCB9253208.1 hypothetical protein [Pseudobdellovibrionaceae bacterium]
MKLIWIFLILSLPAHASYFGPEIFGKGFDSAGGDYITGFRKLDKKMPANHIQVMVKRNGLGICKYQLKGIAVKHTPGSDVFSTYTPYRENSERGDFRSDTKYFSYFRLNDPNIEEIQFFLENVGENDNVWECAVVVNAEPYKESVPAPHLDVRRFHHLDAILYAGGNKLRSLPLGPEGKNLQYVRVQVPAFCNQSVRITQVNVIDSEKESCELRAVSKPLGIYQVHLPPKRSANYIELKLEGEESTEVCAVPVSLFQE